MTDAEYIAYLAGWLDAVRAAHGSLVAVGAPTSERADRGIASFREKMKTENPFVYFLPALPTQ